MCQVTLCYMSVSCIHLPKDDFIFVIWNELSRGLPVSAVAAQPPRLDSILAQVFWNLGPEALWGEEAGARPLKPKHCESTLHPPCLLLRASSLFHLALLLVSARSGTFLFSLLSMRLLTPFPVLHPVHYQSVSYLCLHIFLSPPSPPLLLWTSWAVKNTEPEDRMLGSQLPWKALGRHHACIRPEHWPLCVCVRVWMHLCEICCLSMDIWVNLPTTVCPLLISPCVLLYVWRGRGARLTLCHVNVCICVCVSLCACSPAAGWRVPCSHRDQRGSALSQLIQTKLRLRQTEERLHCWS